MFLSMGKGMGLYLYISQVALEGNSKDGFICIFMSYAWHYGVNILDIIISIVLVSLCLHDEYVT